MKYFFGSAIILLVSCGQHYPPQVTAQKIIKVELGMDKQTVKDILGEPVDEDSIKFTYTEEHAFNYPMLWIHFDSVGVCEVYAKYYEFLDDTGIYGLRYQDSSEFRWGQNNLHKYF